MRNRTLATARFNYPQTLMSSTRILYPLDDDTPPTIVKISRELWKHIKSKLFDANEGQDITFAELLKELDVSAREYIPAIQSSLNWATVFLKKEVQMNKGLITETQLDTCLRAWRANIQFVLDV